MCLWGERESLGGASDDGRMSAIWPLLPVRLCKLHRISNDITRVRSGGQAVRGLTWERINSEEMRVGRDPCRSIRFRLQGEYC